MQVYKKIFGDPEPPPRPQFDVITLGIPPQHPQHPYHRVPARVLRAQLLFRARAVGGTRCAQPLSSGYAWPLNLSDSLPRVLGLLEISGLSGAGKTATLATLCKEDYTDEGPTKGFSIKAAMLPEIVFNFKELGGKDGGALRVGRVP